MQPSKPGQAPNNMRGHASLLLAASKATVVDSPLQKGANNPPAQLDDDLPEDNAINFIKPQNEIFKKLDGKIQKIVAAHSTMNKMYSLNDFSGVGPKKPIELPPQLPRPPPWVPKSEYNCSQWAEETLNNLTRSSLSIDLNDGPVRQNSSLVSLNRISNNLTSQIDVKPQLSKAPTLTIDSAISKLHIRRQQQQQQQQRQQPIPVQQMRHSATNSQSPRLSTQARLLQQAHKLQQQLKAAAAAQSKTANLGTATLTTSSINEPTVSLPSTSARSEPSAQIDLARKSIPLNALLKLQKKASEQQTGVTICPSLSPEEKRRFQNELINIFRQEIAAVTKLAKLKFSPQFAERPKTLDDGSLLIEKSPQSLFNTIRRETSLLLKRGDLHQNRASTSGVSLLTNRGQLSAQQIRSNSSLTDRLSLLPRQQVLRHHTIKVIVPPSEFHKHTCAKHTSTKETNVDCNCYESKSDLLDIEQWLPSRKFTIRYQTLQSKLGRLKFFARLDENDRKRGYIASMTPADARRRKPVQRSLDKIVDRLQARCLSSTGSSPVQGMRSMIPSASSSPIPSQASREPTPSPPSSPRPIPVFRVAPATAKGATYLGNSNSNNYAKVINPKSRKAKRLHHIGLKLSNYLDRENPTPTNEKLTIDQFAKCLNLVRSNDVMIKRHQEKLLQSEMKWRMPVSDRPLRLRRIRGDRAYMPVSASYRATRRVGLQ